MTSLPSPPAARFRAARRAALVACAMLGASARAGAQDAADVIRGRITDDSSRALIASVKVTRGPDRLTQDATVDSNGVYRVRFEQGTGDYLVYVTSPGFKAARRRVQRQGAERELVADFALARDVALLAAVKVTAARPERARNRVHAMEVEPGSSERWSDGVSGQLPPTVAGDLSAATGAMSNIGQGGGGPSILGSGSESNLTTLNGMGLSAGAVPRAARTETRVTGATYDATRGGFSGVNVDVRLGPGSREYQQRRAFVTIDPPAMQFADAVSRSLGARSGGFRASVGADGEIIRQALTYNIALDVARNASSPPTLLDASPDALLRAGVSPDSVGRLMAVAGPLGLPLAGQRFPSSRLRDAFSWIGRLDDTRDTLKTRALTSYVNYTRSGALGFGPLSAPSTSREGKDLSYGAQAVIGNWVGAGRLVLNETRLSLNGSRNAESPYLALPGVNVLVRSSGLEGNDLTSVSLGGGRTQASEDRRWTAEGANETMWNAIGRRHRFRALAWARADGVRQTGIGNQLGTFSYNSIADLAAGRASSFSRTLVQPERTGAVWNGATAFSHHYAPTRYLGLLYGARVEANGFVSSPAANPALEQALGVRTGAAPSRIHVSPRAGFSYVYSRSRENGSGMTVSPMGQFYRYPSGIIRGGIGEFRDLLRPDLLAGASAATGLPGGTLSLTCVGAAAPEADWPLFADPSTVPSECLDGSGAFAERAPSVSLIDPSYDVPRSWRASLDWATTVKSWRVRVEALGSYDLSQPGTVDANFAGEQQFALSGEGSRPVYVTPAAVDPSSGSVSAAESRRSAAFGRVGTRVSDLRGYGGQLTFGVAPEVFRRQSRVAYTTSASYTVQASRRQYRGFDGAAFGDPRTIEWAPNANLARHVVVLTGGLQSGKVGTVTFIARAQSGLPFTPLVQGDLNGDGRAGDRAYVPLPEAEADPAVAAQLRSILSDGAGPARRCIASNLGRVPGRNACLGPWTQSLNMQWTPAIPRRIAGRVRSSLYLQNVLGGIDQLVHRGGSLRGWGSPAPLDPVLLVPRGFDASARRFRYDVNPRFADTRPARTVALNPFRLVIDFNVDLSTNYDLQRLRRAVEPVRGPRGFERRSADSIAAFYLQRTSNIHTMLLGMSDSLFLNASQIERLERSDSVYSTRVRDIYRPLSEFLAAGAGSAGKSQLDSAAVIDTAYWKIFWEQPEVVDSILTPLQKDLVPMVKGWLDTPAAIRLRNRHFFGSPVTLVDRPRPRRAPR